MEAQVGFEPTVKRLQRHVLPLHYCAVEDLHFHADPFYNERILNPGTIELAGDAGFEPTLTESKSVVLPIRRIPNIKLGAYTCVQKPDSNRRLLSWKESV